MAHTFIRNRADNDPRVRRLRELLDLDPNKYSFGIVDTASSGVEQLRSESGKVSQVLEPEPDMAEIVVNNRSMMEVLYFASADCACGSEPHYFHWLDET